MPEKPKVEHRHGEKSNLKAVFVIPNSSKNK